ncbi:LacI family DNA-binding transcriptional regulator [Streptomyces sp. NBC_01497]|uniref:LacI family DNA-binding transcriptional regulator n=1 Tax=Streptomyces sp. NBC_01497 TaxID=2903885 RepID=UPI002E337D8E|nr:LacI family DNA-binding transcriptional regulator [Streptomyces sp. NBC_01497]
MQEADGGTGPAAARGGPGGRVTMRDIAKRAGVHMSTVSRVLSQPALTSSRTPTAVRVRKIAKEMGFEPDQWAASLRSGRTRTVGVVMSRLSDVVVAAVFEAIEQTLSENGLQSLLVGANDTPEAQKRRVDGLLGRRVDGLLLGASRLDDPFLGQLAEQDVPYVLTLRSCGEHPAVTVDDEWGGYLAARHLIERGHRRIAVVAGPRFTSTSRDRERGFARACAEAGMPLPEELVVRCGFDVEAGGTAARMLMDSPRPPTGVFAMTDYSAIGVIGACRDRGLTVGRDFALVGYHDLATSAQLSIPLTSVHSPLQEVGRHAAGMLLRRMAGEEVASARLAPTLRVRASSAAAWPDPEAG